MRIVISAFLRRIVTAALIDSVEKSIKGYFLVGFQKHVGELLNFRSLLWSEIIGYDQKVRDSVLYEFNEYFITGKYPTDLPYEIRENKSLLEKDIEKGIPEEKRTKMAPEDVEKYIKEQIDKLDLTEQTWRHGHGQRVEDELRSLLLRKLGDRRALGKLVVPIEDRTDMVLRLLMKERLKDFGDEEKAIWEKVKQDVTNKMAVYIKNVFRDARRRTLTILKHEESDEVLEPGVKEKGDEGGSVTAPSKARIDPAIKKQDWFDYEEVIAWVEKMFQKYEQIIFMNSLLTLKDDDYLGAEKLSEKIEKETGKKIAPSEIRVIEKKLEDRVHDKFFLGSGIKRDRILDDYPKGDKKSPDEDGKDAEDKLHTLSADEKKKFEEYLDNELTRPQDKAGRPKSSEYIKRVMEVLKYLMSEDKVVRKQVNIAEKLGLKVMDIKNITKNDINPHFKKWVSRGKKEGSMKGLWEFIKTAVSRFAADEEELFDDAMFSDDEDTSDVGEPQKAEPGEFGKLDVKDDDKIDAIKEYHKIPDQKKKDDKLKSFNNMIQKRVIKSPDKGNLFKIKVGFDALYDWDDVGENETNRDWDKDKKQWVVEEKKKDSTKLDPQRDKNGKWVKDDPEFSWKTFSAVLKMRSKSTDIDYNFQVKLSKDGLFMGPPVSNLHVEVTRKSKTHVLDEGSGSAPHFRKVLDDYVMSMENLGLPIEGEIGIGQGAHPLSVTYINVHRVDRPYKGTEMFKQKMGGLAKSNKFHKAKADDYQVFLKKLQEHQTGVHRHLSEMTVGQLSNFLKNIKGEPHITPELKKNAEKWYDYVSKIKDEKNMSREQAETLVHVHQFIKEFQKWEDEYYESLEKTEAKV